MTDVKISDALTEVMERLPCNCTRIGSEIIYNHTDCLDHRGRVRPDAVIEVEGELVYNPE